MLKLSCDRSMPLRQFKDAIEFACSGKGKSLRCEIIGFDNKYFTVYIKKNDKTHSTRTKGGAVKRSPKG